MSDNAPLDREELRRLVAAELELSDDDVTDDAHFADDLGVDSLIAMELIMALERRYGVKLEESALPEMTSLNSIHDMLVDKLQAA